MIDRGILDRIWQQASEHLFITREQYLEKLAAWDIEPVERDGALLGAVMRKADQLHFVTFEAGRITRSIVRDALAPQLEQFGYVETLTPKLDQRQHRFNATIGFVAVGEDEFDIRYRVTREGCRA